MLRKILLAGMFGLPLFAMHNAEININNSDLEVAARLDIGQFNENVEPDTLFLGARYINAAEKHSDLRSIDDYQEISFLMQKDLSEDLRFGLGVKMNHTKNFVSVPLGVEAVYRLPISSSVPFYLGGSLYYAPEVVSFDKAEGYSEYRVNVDAEVIENGFVTIGYRAIDTDYEHNDAEYNHSGYIGFKFLF